MMSLFKKYASTVLQELDYRATWLPGVPISLGAIGVIENGNFRLVTDLKSLGIEVQSTHDNASDQFNFQSDGVMSVSLKAAGELNDQFKAVAKANAGFRVEFNRANAVLIRTKGARIHSVRDIRALDDALIAAATPTQDSEGNFVPARWNRDWVVVTEVVDTAAATILCSTSSEAEIEVEAATSIGPDGIVDASAGFGTKLQKSVGVEVIAKTDITPLYRARRVRENWLWLFDEVVPASFVPPVEGDDVFENDVSDIVGGS